MAHDVFISCTTDDRVVGDAICHALEQAGVRCWIAPRDVEPGVPYARCIMEAIQSCSVMLLVFSRAANESEHVAREVELASRQHKPLLPMRVADVQPKDELLYFIGRAHWLDAFTPPVERHFTTLVAAVRRLVDRAHGPAPAHPGAAAGDAAERPRSGPDAPVPLRAPPPAEATAGIPRPATAPQSTAVRRSWVLRSVAFLLVAAAAVWAVQSYRERDHARQRVLEDERARASGEAQLKAAKAGLAIERLGRVLEAERLARQGQGVSGGLGHLDAALAEAERDAAGDARLPELRQAALDARQGLADDLARHAQEAEAARLKQAQADAALARLRAAVKARSVAEIDSALAQAERDAAGDQRLDDARIAADAVKASLAAEEMASRAESARQREAREEAEAVRQRLFDDAESLRESGDEATAAVLFGRAAEEFQTAGDVASRALALHQQAWCLQPDHNPAGGWDKAVALYGEAVAAWAEAGIDSGRGTSLHNQGDCLSDDDNPARDWGLAAALYGQAADARRAAGDGPGEARSLHSRAWCLQPDNNPDGDWERAFAYFERAASLKGAAGDTSSQAVSLFQCGWTRSPNNNPKGDWGRAADFFARAAAAAAEGGNTWTHGEALYQQAVCLQPSNNPDGDWDRAAALYAEAAGVQAVSGNLSGQGTSLHRSGWCLEPGRNPNGDWARAAAAYEQAIRVREATGETVSLGVSLHNRAAALCQGSSSRMTDEARRLFERAVQLAVDAGDEASAEESRAWIR